MQTRTLGKEHATYSSENVVGKYYLIVWVFIAGRLRSKLHADYKAIYFIEDDSEDSY